MSILEELEIILGKLIAVLILNNALTVKDKEFICGDISEAEWLESRGAENGKS